MKNTAILTFALLLAACSGGAGNSPSSASTTPTTPSAPSPPAPAKGSPYGQLSSTETALVGTDTDGNGVRDDVDSWVQTTYSDASTRAAASTYVHWLTWTMVRSARAHVTTSEELDAMSESSACWAEKAQATLGDKAPKVAEVEALVFNTYARTKAYLAWDASLNGTPSSFSAAPCEHTSEVPAP